jgi:RNA polymerase sigma-70 factor (ECF subfamily)
MNEPEFQLFYNNTYKKLWAYIFRVSNDKLLTDDIAQDAYVRLLQSGRTGLDDDSRKRYLFTIATNLLRDHWRRMKFSTPWSDDEKSVPVESKQPDFDLQQDLDTALQVLSPQQRSLLWLAYVERSNHREIAESLNINEKSVRVLLFRARKKMITTLQRMGLKAEVNN